MPADDVSDLKGRLMREELRNEFREQILGAFRDVETITDALQAALARHDEALGRLDERLKAQEKAQEAVVTRLQAGESQQGLWDSLLGLLGAVVGIGKR